MLSAEQLTDTALLELPEPQFSPLDPAAGQRFVTFFVGGSLYGIAAAAVAEVSSPLPVTPLPLAPENLLGISPVRGEIAAVVNLRRLLGDLSESSSQRQKFVLLRSDEGAASTIIPVDKMHEVVVAELSPDGSNPHPGVTEGIASNADISFPVLKPAALAASLAV